MHLYLILKAVGLEKKSLKKMERLDMQLKGLNADVILCSLFGLTVMKGVVSVVVCVQV